MALRAEAEVDKGICQICVEAACGQGEKETVHPVGIVREFLTQGVGGQGTALIEHEIL